MPPQLIQNQSQASFSDGSVSSVSHQAVIVVDPYSTGCLIVKEMMNRGYDVIALWTCDFAEAMKSSVPHSCRKLDYLAEVTEGSSLQETADRCGKVAGDCDIVACMVGGEAGVELADALSEFMGLRTNGTQIVNRRDKAVQQDLIKAAGIRSVRQAVGTQVDHVESFLREEEYPIVLKPTESAGSDGVKLCLDYEEAVEHFGDLMNKQLVNGGSCPAVLCQEFLKGKEYIVDTVSCNGVHKVMMCVVYDKRHANGSAFVYFGELAIEPDTPEGKVIIPYIRQVLDVLGIKYGPCHGEVIITKDGPCLVEMNCRADGGSGTWHPLYKAMAGGYSQIEASVDAFLNEDDFFALPDEPRTPFPVAGKELHFVSYHEGTVKATPGLKKIQELPSFLSMEGCPQVGDRVSKTIDLATKVGGVILMHEDSSVVENDVALIRQMEKESKLFEVE